MVVEKGYLCSGASGRNGGGVRAQFSSETNVRLMQESLRICRDFAAEMKINVWFRQGGYLFLVRSADSERNGLDPIFGATRNRIDRRDCEQGREKGAASARGIVQA